MHTTRTVPADPPQPPTASLEDKETPVREPPAVLRPEPTPEALPWPWIHAGWRPQRERTYAALLRTDASPARQTAFRLCCTNTLVFQNETQPDTFRLAPARCHDRFCEPCQRLRAATIADNLAKLVRGQVARFVTLTLAADAKPLKDRLNRLFRAFRRLRQTPLWRERVTASASIVEVKRNPDTLNWHVHLHTLLTGRFIPQPELSSEWLRVTGDSRIVDIRLVRSAVYAINYLTKYLAKTADAQTTASPENLDELIPTLHGRRMVITTGAWKNAKLTKTPKLEGWVFIGTDADLAANPELSDAALHEIRSYIAWFNADPTEQSFRIEARPPPLPVWHRPANERPPSA